MAFDFETFGGDEPQEPQVQEAGEFAFEAFGGTEAPPRIEPPKSKTEKIIVEATKTKRKASTPVLGILAALPQAVGQVFTKREFAKTQIELQKNRQEAIKAAQGFIDHIQHNKNNDQHNGDNDSQCSGCAYLVFPLPAPFNEITLRESFDCVVNFLLRIIYCASQIPSSYIE